MRARAIALAACALLFGACAPREAPQPARGEWTAFRLNRELNPVLDSPRGLTVRWSFRTHGGISSSPTVADDTVFLGGNDHRVYALALRTGKPRWTYAADDEVMTAPLVDGGVVVIGEGNNHADESMFMPNDYLLLGDGTNAIVGLDERTGRELWKRRVPGSAMTTGAIVNGAYVQHDAAGMLFAYGVRDGAYRYRTSLASTAAMVAANRYDGDWVVTAGDYPNAVVSLDGRTGETRWRTSFVPSDGGFDDCPLASDGTRIYGTYNARPSDSKFGFVGFTTPAIQHVYALDAESGSIRWDVTLGRGILPVNNSTAIPMLDRGRLLIGSAMLPQMVALDAATGRVLWNVPVGGPVKGGVVAKDGIAYFGDAARTFWALDERDGSVRGRTIMRDAFGVGSPIVVGETLIVGTMHGTVIARPLAGLQSGARVSRAPIPHEPIVNR